MAQLLPIILLSAFGFFNLFGIDQSVVLRQFLYIVASFIAFFTIKKIKRPFFETNSSFFYYVFVFILIATYIIGFEVKGSKRWIDLVFFNFQASEFFKIVCILFLAERFSRLKKKTYILYALIPAFIVFKQPDLGNAVVIMFSYVVMLFFSDVPKKKILAMIMAVVILLPIGWVTLKDYQKDRIISYIAPHTDTQGTAYNMIQSIITIGSGGVTGKGMGEGTQSRLAFLPENNTDFAYAALVEQFGFIGGGIVIALFGFLIWGLISKAIFYYYNRNSDNRHYFLYSVGFLSYIVFQIIVNIGMNLGMLPIAGIALPFISYGGSSIVAFMLGYALIP